MANEVLLRKVLHRIEGNQTLWDQEHWSQLNFNGFSGEQLRAMVLEDPQNPACGAAHCFAGTAVVFEGWVPVFELDLEDESFGQAEFCVRKGTTFDKATGQYDMTDCERISEQAIELLDISASDASKLFNYDNGLPELRQMVTHLCDYGTLDPVTCPECSGDGVTEGCCSECGQETSVECSNCDGSGEVGGY